MRYHYPINYKIRMDLEEKYREEAKTKGNSWQEDTSIKYLKAKLEEEFNEVKESFFNEHTYYETIEELKDLILVAGMLYRRLTE